ncbi:LysR family transcriptional regulator [Variovorax sp. JS1663]|uniref:LysR family transcriptional regulator n=1 Tax=Variovorax sp. JS1663 TaxID=1851577 RepID=UPI000B345F31|nr:LysR family transcriptional regulator [Variovorax sp. JS1663]OUM00968.1 LysR family transcriptional regulator [Variovorax sp. JS1663]
MKIENISDLLVLVHTARGGTLTAAARSLGLTPAAASAALKRLETQLGARLFERSTRAMRLTAQGQTLLDYASRAFELLAEGESLVTADRGALVGMLRVAAPSDLTRGALLPWFDEFLEAHPGLQLALSVGDRPLDVTRDEVDVALRYGALADSRLVARKLADSRPVLCAAPAYLQRHPAPQVPQDLLQHNCLTFHRSGRRQRLWRFARHGQWTEVRVDGDRIADDASLARQWAVEGRGITLKSMLDVRSDEASGALVRLLPEWDTESYPLHALLPSGRFVPARVGALVDFLAAKFAQCLPLAGGAATKIAA